MNTGMHVSFRIRVFSGLCPGVGLLDYMILCYFYFFKGISILFSIVAVPVYIPTNSVLWLPDADSLEKTLMLGKIEGRSRRG